MARPGSRARAHARTVHARPGCRGGGGGPGREGELHPARHCAQSCGSWDTRCRQRRHVSVLASRSLRLPGPAPHARSLPPGFCPCPGAAPGDPPPTERDEAPVHSGLGLELGQEISHAVLLVQEPVEPLSHGCGHGWAVRAARDAPQPAGRGTQLTGAGRGRAVPRRVHEVPGRAPPPCPAPAERSPQLPRPTRPTALGPPL